MRHHRLSRLLSTVAACALFTTAGCADDDEVLGADDIIGDLNLGAQQGGQKGGQQARRQEGQAPRLREAEPFLPRMIQIEGQPAGREQRRKLNVDIPQLRVPTALADVQAARAVQLGGQEAEQPAAEPTHVESDARLVGILEAANQAEMDLSQFAAHQASIEGAARSFALEMLEKQTIAQQQIEQLKATMQVQPVESQVARALEQKSAQVKAMLEDLSGDDFDRAYLDAQIGMHAQRLLLIDTLMMPAVSGAMLEQMLVDHRAETQRHLAKSVQRRAEIEE